MIEEIKTLFDAAVKVRENSYSPYSNFKVGAVLECESGKIYTGTNVENASFGATVCAERIAIFKAISDGERKFKRIVLVADTEKPPSPCGVCRQVMSEFNSELEIYMCNLKGDCKKVTLLEIFPEQFRL